jgi:peptide/nickel transport system permease protein
MYTEEEKKTGKMEEIASEIKNVVKHDTGHRNEFIEETDEQVGFQVIVREFKKERFAVLSFWLLIILLASIFVGAALLDKEQVMRVDILNRYATPGRAHLLGTDEGGRDVFGQLLIGARNSAVIGVSVTVLTGFIGIGLGIISGYYGGVVDSILMRTVDFVMVLPANILIIVFVSMLATYNMATLILIMSAFSWMGKARIFRSRTLSEKGRDYVNASKTMGTSDFKIMFREMLPNLSSLIIVNSALNIAGNIGIETGLSFLGFGLPLDTPSLGTLIGYATSSDVITNKAWVWLPAVLLVLVLMLCINYIGQALQRAADSKQRLG